MRRLLPLILAGACDREAIPEAAVFYEQGEYDRAIEILDQAGGDAPSGVALYDLGGALYRKGDVGRAIAAWRGAHVELPRDGDASHNLALARASLEGVPEPVPMHAEWMEVATPFELGAVGLFLVAIASAGAIWRERVRHRDPEHPTAWIWPWATVALTGALVTSAAIAGWYDRQWRPVAVIVEADVPLRAEPEPAAIAKAKLPAGTEVYVERRVGPFVRVRASDDRWGWVGEETVTIVR